MASGKSELNPQIAEMIAKGRHLVPAHMWGAVEGYYLHGFWPGSFLTAFMSNDLIGALGCADDVNARSFKNWALFFYNHTPCGSYGSPARIEAWLAKFPTVAEQVAA